MLYLNQNHLDILTKNVPTPVRLNLELTTQCNLNCIMCRGSKSFNNSYKVDKHLTVNEFTEFLKGVNLHRLKVLNLAGNSEPLINPNILQIISICRELRIIIEMITNGMLLTPEVSRQLLGCSSEIHVSFGGATKIIFESIRQGSNFDRICNNIRFLSQLKKEQEQEFPRIWINPILMKRNLHELTGMVELAKELDCYGVACSHLIVNSPELIEESLYFFQDECNQVLKEAKKVAEKNNINLLIPPFFSMNSQSEPHKTESVEGWKRCRFLWNHAILSTESFMPCGSLGVIDDFDGDVTKNKFEDIWNNDWYAHMRYRLLTGNPPEKCINCKDPSVKDVNHIGSYFEEDILIEHSKYSKQFIRSNEQIEFQLNGNNLKSTL